jgi:VWFA-related protein
MDLGKPDFEVYEDGKKMALGSADLIRLAGGQAAPAPAATPSPAPPKDSRFVVVFDSINTIKRMLDRSKPELLAQLVSLIELGQEIMVFELAEDGRMLVLQPLTRDRALVAKAVEKAAGSIWVEKSAETLAVPAIVDRRDAGRELIGESGERVSGLAQSLQAVFEAETRRRFEKTINGLLGVMNVVKDFEGRKSLLFVSGGIPSLSFIKFFEGGGVADATGIQSQVAAAKVRDPFKVLGPKGFRTGSEIFDDLVRFANSHNVSFYSLDPDNYLRYVLGNIADDNFPRALGRVSTRGSGVSRPDEFAEIKRSELASLKALSEDTGGATFLGGDKFEAFAKVIERDFTQYYELSYAPARKKADGKYHKIEVKCLRPGVEIRFRRGYLDYTDDQKESLTFASAAYNPTLFRAIPFDGRIVPFARGRNKFLLWIQTALPVRKVIGGRVAEDKPVTLKFKITLDDPEGESGFLSEVAIPLALTPAFLQRIKSAEYFGWSCASQETELEPKAYRATLALYNRDLDEMGTVERFLEVPELKEGATARVLTTVVGNLLKTDKAMVLPFTIANDDGTLDVPNFKFFPMAVAHVQRGRRAGLLVQVYSAQKPEKAALGASVARAGAATGSGSLPIPAGVVYEEWNKKTGIWNVLYELGLESLGPADYGVALRWTDASGAAWVEGSIDVRIL